VNRDSTPTGVPSTTFSAVVTGRSCTKRRVPVANENSKEVGVIDLPSSVRFDVPTSQNMDNLNRNTMGMRHSSGPGSAAPNSNSAPRDEELVTRTLAGDRDAYRLLVEKYQGKILALALDVLKSREDAEDIVQESFVKAYLSLASFKGESSFYTWLYRIAYNMSIDVRRRTARRGGAHLEFKESASVSRGIAGGNESGGAATAVPEHLQNVEGPHEALHRKETGAKIQEVLQELSPEHRAVIVLREVDGLDYGEISDATGVPRGTVMSRLHYARKALQKALKDLAPSFLRGTEPAHTDDEDRGDSDKEVTAAGAQVR
jgi:RNA polymerase sigma-70 factor (ECF subfamily)